MNHLLQKFERVVNRRIDVAVKWFGLSDQAAVADFVQRDADVEACLANPMLIRQLGLAVITEIIDGVRLDEHRKRFGDEFVDCIIATSERIHREGK
jgi:hypothetical protein